MGNTNSSSHLPPNALDNHEELIKYLKDNMGMSLDHLEKSQAEESDAMDNRSHSTNKRKKRVSLLRKLDDTWLAEYHEKERPLVEKKQERRLSKTKSEKPDYVKQCLRDMDPQSVITMLEMYANADDTSRAAEYIHYMHDLPSATTEGEEQHSMKKIIHQRHSHYHRHHHHQHNKQPRSTKNTTSNCAA